MPSVTVRATLPAPVDEVVAFVADARNDPTWAPMVSDVTQVAGDGPGPGARWSLTQGLGPGRSTRAEVELVTWDPPHELGWVMHGLDYRSTMRFSPAGGDRTRVVQTNTVVLGSASESAVWFASAHVVLRLQLRLLARALRRRRHERTGG